MRECTQLLVTYVELHCHSAYSFLDGASHLEELVARAAELGYEALALTDHDGVYGSLEFAHAAKLAGIRPITGAEDPRRRRLAGAAQDGAGFAGTGAGRGGAHVTLLCETGEATRTSAASSRQPACGHAPTREGGPRPLPPAVPLETVAELNEGSSVFRLRPRRVRAARPARRRPTGGRVRPGAVPRRAATTVRAGRHTTARSAP